MGRHNAGRHADNQSTVDGWGVVTVRDHRSIPIIVVILVVISYILPDLIRPLINEASSCSPCSLSFLREVHG
jgi:hypothetical protein